MGLVLNDIDFEGKDSYYYSYHYYQNLGFTEIAGLLGVGRSRVSQIHRQALALLRQARASAGSVDLGA